MNRFHILGFIDTAAIFTFIPLCVRSFSTTQPRAIKQHELWEVAETLNSRLQAEINEKENALDGYVTATAYDGTSALEVSDSFRPDLVITDAAMPSMSGIELAAALREK